MMRGLARFTPMGLQSLSFKGVDADRRRYFAKNTFSSLGARSYLILTDGRKSSSQQLAFKFLIFAQREAEGFSNINSQTNSGGLMRMSKYRDHRKRTEIDTADNPSRLLVSVLSTLAGKHDNVL